MKKSIIIFGLSVIIASLAGCEQRSKQPQVTPVVIPTAAMSPEYRGDGSIPEQRYVIRMSDGRRDWEVQFPEVATAYEIRIPLDGTSQRRGIHWEEQDLTDADRELLRRMRRDNPGMERQGVFEDGRNILDDDGMLIPGSELDEEGRTIRDPGAARIQGTEAEAAPSRPSYLLGIEQVQQLFSAGNYELAMVRLVQLEKAYPDDVRILSMKGTLWLRLSQPELARETWERVLQIDPDNRAVIEALRRLNQGE